MTSETEKTSTNDDNNKNDSTSFETQEEKDAKALIAAKLQKDVTTRVLGYLIDKVAEKYDFRTLDDTREIVYYDDEAKIWRFKGDVKILEEVEKLGQHAIPKQMKQEVIGHIQDRDSTPRNAFDDANNPFVVNLENIRLDILRQCALSQESEDNLSFSKFPIVFDPMAECPNVEKFLMEVILDPYKLKEVCKFIASILIGDNRYEKALMLLGEGANGKSKFILLLEAMLGGHDKCSHVSLNDVEDDRFATAGLFGKRLNTWADNKSGKLKNTGNIKLLISGDPIEAQHKNKPRFSFVPRAKIVVSTNNAPETADQTYAWFRRWLLVGFDRTFVKDADEGDPNKADLNLIEKITTPSELSGLLNLALKYVPVLIRENGFSEESIEITKHEYNTLSSNLSKYLADRCTINFGEDPKKFNTETKILYKDYVDWCEREGLKAIDDNVFGSKLVERGIQKKQHRVKGSKKDRKNVYENVMLTHVIYAQSKSTDITQSIAEAAAATATNDAEKKKREQEQKELQGQFIHECKYCALENDAGNMPLFGSVSDKRKVQRHIVLKHPGLDFEYLDDDIDDDAGDDDRDNNDN